MYETITDEFIISTISCYKEEMLLMEGKIRAIEASLSDDTDLIVAASLPAADPETPKSPNHPLKDLGDVYETYMALAKNQREDCIAYVSLLARKKDCMDRVMAAYGNLPEREYRVLEMFCRKRRRYRCIQAVRETMHALYLSESTVQRIRRQALLRIRELYESDRSLLDLKMAAVDAGLKRKQESALS